MSYFSINVLDIQKNQYEKDKSRLKIYNRILEKCYYKIKSSSDNESNFCFFQIPEYIPGEPIYNLTKCVIFMLQHLRKNGFISKYCHPFLLYISWKQEGDMLLLNSSTNYTAPKKKATSIYDIIPKKNNNSSNNYSSNNYTSRSNPLD